MNIKNVTLILFVNIKLMDWNKSGKNMYDVVADIMNKDKDIVLIIMIIQKKIGIIIEI